MPGRFVIEGTWVGYRRQQDRVVHRTVHTADEKKLRAWAESTHAIRYSDGTSLLIAVRDCKPRERVQQQNSYGRLIRDCAYYNVTSVDALEAAERAARTAATGA
jgi:hypothetical protein